MIHRCKEWFGVFEKECGGPRLVAVFDHGEPAEEFMQADPDLYLMLPVGPFYVESEGDR